MVDYSCYYYSTNSGSYYWVVALLSPNFSTSYSSLWLGCAVFSPVFFTSLIRAPKLSKELAKTLFAGSPREWEPDFYSFSALANAFNSLSVINPSFSWWWCPPKHIPWWTLWPLEAADFLTLFFSKVWWVCILIISVNLVLVGAISDYFWITSPFLKVLNSINSEAKAITTSSEIFLKRG